MAEEMSLMQKSTLGGEVGRLLSLAASAAGLHSHNPLPEPGRIAILKLWAAGECLMATPVVAALKDRWPHTNITVITGKRCAPLWKMCPGVDEIISLPEEAFLSNSPVKLVAIIMQLRKLSFDVTITLHHSYFFTLFSALAFSGAARCGMDRAGEGFLHHFTQPSTSPHRIDDHLSAVYALGAHPANWLMSVVPPPAVVQRVKAELGGELPWLALAPGGGRNVKTVMPSKIYPWRSYLEVVHQISQKRKIAVLLVGDSHDMAQAGPLAEALTGQGIKCLNRVGVGGWEETAAALSLCCGFVGNDSAPMHLSAALGIPTLGLFGPTVPEETGPRGIACAALEPERQHEPCYKHGIFNGNCTDPCIAHIKPASVVEKLLSIIRF